MRPIVLLALAASAPASAATQCFAEAGTYGDLTVTTSGDCSVFYGTDLWLGSTNISQTCTFSFDHDVDPRTATISVAYLDSWDPYGEMSTFLVDGQPVYVDQSDILSDPSTALVAVGGSVYGNDTSFGSGDVTLNGAPAAGGSITIAHTVYADQPLGAAYVVCVDDTRVVGDADGDGTDDASDCAPNDATIFPGATETCDGVDQDCDGTVDEDVGTEFHADDDGDGFGDPYDFVDACTAPVGYVADFYDCDDTLATVNPDAVEICNADDDDCDALIDEGTTTTYYADADADGYGDAVSTTQACAQPSGFVTDTTDCNDTTDTIHPGADEVCDGVDQDCDLEADEGVLTAFYADADADGFGNSNLVTDACVAPVGYVDQPGDCDDGDVAVNPLGTEICNGIDDDCDGAIDPALTLERFEDLDGDGFGDPDAPVAICAEADGFVADDTDCDDDDATVNPDATEICDGIDQNCDGNTDEGVTTDFFVDVDADGYGTGDAVSACTAPSGFVATGDDCDDADVDTHPSAPETCTDPLDRNCDGVVGRVDTDADGFAACEECDDLDADVNPNGTELCNGIDDDCDGTTDVGAEDASSWYADADDDGFTDPDDGVLACDAPEGYRAESSNDDCDDTDADINPDAADEPGDGIDQDCDGADAEVEDTDVQDTDVEDTDVEDTDLGETDVIDTDAGGGCSCNKNQSAAGWLGLLALGGLFARRRRVA